MVKESEENKEKQHRAIRFRNKNLKNYDLRWERWAGTKKSMDKEEIW